MNNDRVDLMDYVSLLYRKRIFLAACLVFAAAAGVAVALRQKPVWTSSATLLPSESKGESGGFAGLAALAGLSVPQTASPETFYRNILLSDDFMDSLSRTTWKTSAVPDRPRTLAEIYEIKPDTSKPYWRDRERQRMIEFIRKKRIVGFERDPDGLMTLRCSTIDPMLSYEMTVFLLDQLDHYNHVRKKTRTSEKKALIESRLKEVEENLKQSEDRLRAFRERNLSVSTPALLLEQQRLMRELEVNGSLYQELRKQFEIAKIEVVDNTQFLNVLEKPEVPLLSGKSDRRKTVFVFSFMGLIAGIAWVLASAKFKEIRARWRQAPAPVSNPA